MQCVSSRQNDKQFFLYVFHHPSMSLARCTLQLDEDEAQQSEESEENERKVAAQSRAADKSSVESHKGHVQARGHT